MTLPLVGVTAVIAGMSVFNRDAAQVETSLLRINRITQQMEAQTIASNLGAAQAFSSTATAVATGAVVIGGALALGGIAAVKFAADFEQSLARTKAFSGATGAQMDALKVVITDLSRTGTLGMADLAEATTELARSGVPLPDILGGALEAVRNLTIASGGELGLAPAAKLVATSMNAFGLEVTEVDRVTTAATVLAQNSAATFTGFGEGVAIAGASFRAAGFSLEDFAIAETILTQKGMSATVAATALRGVIQRLEKPSKDAAKVMETYGIHLFDAAGKGVGFRAVLAQLHEAFGQQQIDLGKVTEEERAQALAALGLQRTSVALFNLAIEGTDAYDALAASFERLRINDLVDQLLVPLNAQMEIATNNVLALAVAFGGQFLEGLGKGTRGVVAFLQSINIQKAKDWADSVIDAGRQIGDAIGGAIAFVQNLSNEFGLTAASGEFLRTMLVGIGIVILSVLIPPVLGVIAAFGGFALVIGIVATAVEKVSGFVASAATTIANWAQDMGLGGAIVADAFRVISDAALAVGALLRGDFSAAGAFAGLAFHDFADGIKEEGGEALGVLGQSLDDIGAKWAPWAAGAGDAGVVVSAGLSGVHGIVEALAFLLQGNFAAAGASAQGALENFGKAIEPIRAAIDGALKVAFTWLSEVAWPAIQTAAQNTANYYSTSVAPKLAEVATAINGALKTALDWLRDAWPTIQGTAGNFIAYLTGPVATALNNLANLISTTVHTAFNWLIVTGWPLIKQGAEETARAVREQVIPSMTELATTISGKVQPAVNDFGTKGLPAIQAAAETLGPSLSKLGEFFGLTAESTFKALGIADDLSRTWSNLQLAGQLLSAGITNIGLALGTLFGPLGQAAAGIDGVGLGAKLAALVLQTFILGIKGISSLIGGVSELILAGAKSFSAIAESIRLAQLRAIEFKEGMGAAMAGAVLSITENLDKVPGIVANLGGVLFTAADIVGGQIGNGLISGITGTIGRVAAAAAALGARAIQAAREAVGAHSPSRDFELLGQDMGEGLDLGLLSKVPKVIETAKTYGDSILAEMATFTQGVETASRDIGAKLEDIATDVGEKIAATIDKANHDIQVAIDNAQSSFDSLGGEWADPMSTPVRSQEVTDRVAARKAAYRQNRTDEEAAFQKTKDLTGVETAYKKSVLVENSKTSQELHKEDVKFEQALDAATTDAKKGQLRIQHEDRVAAINQSHKDDQDNLDIKRAADLEAINQRFEDRAAEIARTRKLDADEAAYYKTQDEEIRKFKQDQIIKDRDAKIAAIEEAERLSTITIAANADKQRDLLLRSYSGKIADLKDKLLDKIPPLTAESQAALDGFLANVATETDATVKQITDAMGTTTSNAVKEVGTTADRTLGQGGVVPTASDITTAAFKTATTAAGDLRGTDSTGMLGGKDAATQISFVLQQLADKMPGLVKGVLDLVDAINKLQDKTVTITTIHKDVGGADGGALGAGSSALSAALANPGASGPGGSYDAARVVANYKAGGIPTFAEGGVVPGRYGQPVLAVVHAGEFISALNTEASRWARQMAMYQPQISKEYNYNVNASYANMQSPASVEMDMRALVALSRTS